MFAGLDAKSDSAAVSRRKHPEFDLRWTCWHCTMSELDSILSVADAKSDGGATVRSNNHRNDVLPLGNGELGNFYLIVSAANNNAMHTKRRSYVQFQWRITRRRSVIADVIPPTRDRKMQTQIDELTRKLNLVSGRLWDAEQVRSDAKCQLADVRNRISSMSFRKQLYRGAAWNRDRADADPIWNFAFPLSLVAVFIFIVFAPVWFFTGSIGFAAITFLLVSIVTVGGFLAINAPSFSNPHQKLAGLTKELEAAHLLRESRSRYLESCRNAVKKIEEQKSKIEIQLGELTASVAFQKELQINSILSQEWRLLRGVPWEEFLLKLLECHGYTVQTTSVSGDQGVDLVAKKHGISIAIQAKGYANNVGNSAVQQAYTGMAIYRCTHCAVITNSEFTASALDAAEKTGCILVGCSDILSFANGTLESFYSIGGRMQQPAG